jgi:hypothetical protein
VGRLSSRAVGTAHLEQRFFGVSPGPDPRPPFPAVRRATASVTVSAYKTQQHRLLHRGQTFHFVSYEAQAADAKRQTAAMPPTWYVMLGGKRWAVIEQAGETELAELERRFGEWLDAHVSFAEPAA